MVLLWRLAKYIAGIRDAEMSNKICCTLRDGDMVVAAVIVAEVVNEEGKRNIRVFYNGHPEQWDKVNLLNVALRKETLTLDNMWRSSDE